MGYLVSAVIFLHFLCFPIVVGVQARVDTERNAAKVVVRPYGIVVFKKRFDTDIVKKMLNGSFEQKPPGNSEKSQKQKPPSGFLVGFLLNLLKRVVVEYLYLNAAVGTGDAASTAVLAGGARVAYRELCEVIGYSGEATILPFYDYAMADIDFDGIFCMNIANIIIAFVCSILPRAGEQKPARRKNADIPT